MARPIPTHDPVPLQPRCALLYLRLACLLTVTLPSHAADEPRVTVWRGVDGLPQSATIGVTITPRGRVLSTHNPTLPVARLDGFQILALSNSVGAASRVHESRSEQLWSVTPEGLQENTGSGWNLHPVAEIAAEFRGNPLRSVRPLPIIPLDRNRVLVLLPDRLIEYDAAEHRALTLTTAASKSIGRFNELNPAWTDGAWISGNRGLIRIPAPIRHLRPDTPLEEFILPDTLQAADLQRPFENRLGHVVMAAEDRETRERLILRFANQRWDRWSVHGHNLRQAWAGADGELWGHTSGAVFRFDQRPDSLQPVPILQVGRVADLALEPEGAAWIASSEGLFRIAPLPWRSVPGFDPGPTAVLSVTTDRRGRWLAATRSEIHTFDGTSWSASPYPGFPEEETSRFHEVLYPLADGSLWARGLNAHQLLSPDASPLPIPDSLTNAQPIALLPDGRLVLHQPASPIPTLVTFDGTSVAPYSDLPDDPQRLGPLSVVLATRTGELWVGGSSGLALRRGGQWRFIDPRSQGQDQDPDPRPFDGALAGLETTDGRILIGGRDALREFDGQSWRVLRRDLETVHAIHSTRDGALWVASGSGLHRFKDRSWFVLADDEGLPAGAVHAIHTDGSGRIWAATPRGLYAFDPRTDTDPPQAEIADADLPTQAGDDRARFVVGGSDRWRYTPPGRLQFSWRLDNGPWSIWRAASSDQFSQLPPGIHRFEARALDPSGNHEGPTAVREFTVMLPWFREPRLVLASAALAVLLLALGVQAVHGYFRLKRSYAEVGRQVAERSAALEKANAELLHSHKMRALGTLAAGVAHDFNNLLSIIKGSTQLLEAQLTDTDKSRQRIQRIKTAVDQGAGLVKAMLGYSRDSSQARREITPESAASRAIRLMEERLNSRLVLVPPPSPAPTAFAQPEMLQQILLNLIQNADEAMEHRGTIEVRVHTVPAPPDPCLLQPATAPAYVCLAVHDSGLGIPPENLSRIFEPFFTTKGFSSRRGTGLGLSMVYEFAKEMGAGIAVDSTLGQGSTFTIILPTTPAPPHPGATANKSPAGTPEP